ncbi:hypothetical protein Ddye_017150 [Dipteronia dyeriana]|uniref:Uncharacterized protein n=1 Tax=Dipteronia dyeriana TaxID=168575 RepID=A0AAD9U829_9ROSI|nr:hypothetical protein Ddye_017150 [Dipteronia dyeriana]
MTMNIKNTFKWEDVTGIFKHAYKIYKESKFNEEMNELMWVHQMAYDDLMTIGPARWSLAYSPFPVAAIDAMGNKVLNETK